MTSRSGTSAHRTELVHIDVKKIGTISGGGAGRFHDRGSEQAKAARPGDLGYGYLHTVADDHSCLASPPRARGGPSEILSDEEGSSTAAFRARVNAWFAGCGTTIARASVTTVPTTAPASSPPP